MKRSVKQIVNSQDVMMGDVIIGQPLPSSRLEQISPFILLHHGAPKKFEPGGKSIDVGPHPHRGFEPVSFIFKGEVEHSDSRGNNRVIKEGGVQWLTSGMGIIHAEKASKEFRERGGEFEMIQLWINLPKKFKMIEPGYQPFDKDEIPFYNEQNSRVNVISGEMNGVKGPINSLTNVMALTLEMEVDGALRFEIPEDRNILLYQLNGRTLVNGVELGDKQLVEFEKEGNEVIIKSSEKSLLLFLAGDPINEPMVKHGPFVMNTQTEVLEAMRDYQMGKMGFLPSSQPETTESQASN